MSPRTILTLSNGKGIDLLDPQPADIDFAAIAEHLGKEARYNGATPDTQYSVAQHCALGADAILQAGGSEAEAAYFLLHDGHEATLKDDTTPKKHALAEIAQEQFGILADDIVNAFALLTYRHDVAIHAAAGLDWPMSSALQHTIKKFDVIMFVTEWRDLMHAVPHPNWAPYSGIQPLPYTIEPWPWPQARAGWLWRANKLLPALQRGGRAFDKSRREHAGTSE